MRITSWLVLIELSIFTNIPIDGRLQVIKSLLMAPDMYSLFSMGLKLMYFCCDGLYYI